jgi:CRP/FNR family cyclic AMP-dependent transcriptional regulator
MASLFDSLEKVEFDVGDILLRQGDHGYFFYIIQDGEVEVYSRRPDGSTVPLGTIGAGQALGEFALITGAHRSASARAITKGHAVKIGEDVYRELLQELPDWATIILESLVQRMVQLNQLVPSIQPVDDITQVVR